MDLLEHGPPDVDPVPARPLSPRALVGGLAVANLVAAGAVALTRPAPTPAPVVAASVADAAPRRSVPAARRAVPLPPGRPRRTSPAQIGVQAPEVPRLGTVTGVVGRRPTRTLAIEATYAMAARLCRDPSLVRLQLLANSADWSRATYFVRVLEERPPEGSFVVQLSWSGRGYDYHVTGKGGDCKDKGTG